MNWLLTIPIASLYSDGCMPKTNRHVKGLFEALVGGHDTNVDTIHQVLTGLTPAAAVIVFTLRQAPDSCAAHIDTVIGLKIAATYLDQSKTLLKTELPYIQGAHPALSWQYGRRGRGDNR